MKKKYLYVPLLPAVGTSNSEMPTFVTQPCYFISSLRLKISCPVSQSDLQGSVTSQTQIFQDLSIKPLNRMSQV